MMPFDAAELSPQYGAARTSLRMRSPFSPAQFERTTSRNSASVQALSSKQTLRIARSESATLPTKPSVTIRGWALTGSAPSFRSRRLLMPPGRSAV